MPVCIKFECELHYTFKLTWASLTNYQRVIRDEWMTENNTGMQLPEGSYNMVRNTGYEKEEPVNNIVLKEGSDKKCK